MSADTELLIGILEIVSEVRDQFRESLSGLLEISGANTLISKEEDAEDTGGGEDTGFPDVPLTVAGVRHVLMLVHDGVKEKLKEKTGWGRLELAHVIAQVCNNVELTMVKMYAERNGRTLTEITLDNDWDPDLDIPF